MVKFGRQILYLCLTNNAYSQLGKESEFDNLRMPYDSAPLCSLCSPLGPDLSVNCSGHKAMG
jgi:hypothetical protein